MCVRVLKSADCPAQARARRSCAPVRTGEAPGPTAVSRCPRSTPGSLSRAAYATARYWQSTCVNVGLSARQALSTMLPTLPMRDPLAAANHSTPCIALKLHFAHCGPCGRTSKRRAVVPLEAVLNVEFSIRGLVARAPGLTEEASWRAWFAQPQDLQLQDSPALTEMPSRLRSRLSRLGRIALEPAYACLSGQTGIPVVFGSRYGDVARGADVLLQLARQEPLSPVSFSLSVHNAIAGLFSIAQRSNEPYSVIAAGEETVEATFVEACALARDGRHEVLVVIYDEPLRGPWRPLAGPVYFPRAFALRLSSRGAGSYYTLSSEAREWHAPADAPKLPSDLALLRFLLTAQDQFEHLVPGRCWRWQRHDRNTGRQGEGVRGTGGTAGGCTSAPSGGAR